ncbi:histone H3.3-like [Chelonus insularis]|uniref:histone H3.3-like n=1 Tax=Chelonus insularis TaxID=460826 RepID=UPI001589DB40|nr:histone H3.3-like [Chelonus insularis]
MVRRKSDKSGPLRSPKKIPEGKNKRRTEVIVPKIKKIHRQTRALQEIKYYRKSTKLLIPKLPFSRLVREIMSEIFPNTQYKIQALALQALQESTEMYIVQFFEDAVLISYNSKRVTLMHRDFILLRRLRGRGDIINR